MTPTRFKQKLKAVGVSVLNQEPPSTLAGALSQIEQLGALTGHVKSADKLAASIKSTINADIASVPKHPGKTLTAYYELDTTFYSLTSSTFVGSLLKSLGVVNIADAKNTTADAGYPAVERRVHRERQSQDDLPRRHDLLQAVRVDGRQATRFLQGRGGAGPRSHRTER